MVNPLPISRQLDSVVLDPSTAYCLERTAWAQVQQEKYDDAHMTYSLLLKMPESQQYTILSDLGFIERALGRVEQAKSSFIKALKSDDESLETVEQLLVRSGLYACITELGSNPEDHAEVAKALSRYDNGMTGVFNLPTSILPIDDGPFSFPMKRQLESLLFTCSIPVRNDHGVAGIALMDADPLNCLHEGVHV